MHRDLSTLVSECAPSHIQTETAELFTFAPYGLQPPFAICGLLYRCRFSGSAGGLCRQHHLEATYLWPNNEKTFHAQRGGNQRLLRTPDEKAATCMQQLSKGGIVNRPRHFFCALVSGCRKFVVAFRKIDCLSACQKPSGLSKCGAVGPGSRRG